MVRLMETGLCPLTAPAVMVSLDERVISKPRFQHVPVWKRAKP